MTRAPIILVCALLASCANPKKTAPATSAEAASAPAPPASDEPSTLATAPAVTSSPAAPPPPSAALPGEATANAHAQGPLQSRVEGCLSEPNPEATKTRAMPKPDRVEVESDGGGLRVTHHVNHACCLKAATRVEREGKSVTLVEALSGTPCRCRCSSVVYSQLPLPVGEYDFRLRLEQPSGKTDVHRQTVRVSEASSKPKLPPKIKLNLEAPKP